MPKCKAKYCKNYTGAVEKVHQYNEKVLIKINYYVPFLYKIFV